MRYYIDWPDIMDGYNKRYKTKYTDLKKWLSDFYTKTKSTNTMRDITGVNACIVRIKMRALGIPIQKRGGDYFSRSIKQQVFLSLRPWMKDKTLSEIAKEAGITVDYARVLALRYGCKYKSLRAPKAEHLRPKILKIFTDAYPGDEYFEKYMKDILNHRTIDQLRVLYKELIENDN